MYFSPFNSIVSVVDAAEALAVGLDGVDWATTSGRCLLAVNSAGCGPRLGCCPQTTCHEAEVVPEIRKQVGSGVRNVVGCCGAAF